MAVPACTGRRCLLGSTTSSGAPRQRLITGGRAAAAQRLQVRSKALAEELRRDLGLPPPQNESILGDAAEALRRALPAAGQDTMLGDAVKAAQDVLPGRLRVQLDDEMVASVTKVRGGGADWRAL